MSSVAAQVLVNYGKHLYVECESGEIIECVARKVAKKAVAGDHVEIGIDDNNKGVVEKILPRTSVFERPDKYGKIKALAANIDQVFITTAVAPTPNSGLIDHYLVACHLFKFTPILLLNKVDLKDNENVQQLMSMVEVYQALGYPVLETCCKREGGLDMLLDQLQAHTSMFVGQSGVGKSSIINKLFPAENLRTGTLSEKSGEGMHTTTSTKLYRLTNGGAVIDSPGIREFRISHLSHLDVAKGFLEISDNAADCKFHNCSHINEPKCAVKALVESGDIAQVRYDSYKRMVESTDHS